MRDDSYAVQLTIDSCLLLSDLRTMLSEPSLLWSSHRYFVESTKDKEMRRCALLIFKELKSNLETR